MLGRDEQRPPGACREAVGDAPEEGAGDGARTRWPQTTSPALVQSLEVLSLALSSISLPVHLRDMTVRLLCLPF